SLVLINQSLTELKLDQCAKLSNLDLTSLDQLTNLDISHNLQLSRMYCDTELQPIKNLREKIQSAEQRLADCQRSNTGKQEEINRLEQELQQLRELKSRLESNWEQKE
ncbi:712_t:CDS:1, partial [Racocetra persica]